MKKIELYRLKGLYREDFVVEGYRFGGEDALFHYTKL